MTVANVEQTELAEVNEQLESEEVIDEVTTDESDENIDPKPKEQELQRGIAEYTVKLEELEAIIEEYRITHVKDKKSNMLMDAHYSPEQVARYVDLIEGETDTEISKSISEFQSDIPAHNRTKCAEPLTGGQGAKGSTRNFAKRDGYQKGREAYDKHIRKKRRFLGFGGEK